MSIVMGTTDHIDFAFSAADLAANTPIELVAPVSGWIKRIRTTVNATITTGGTIVVKTGAAVSPADPETTLVAVAGMSVTIANSAAVGTTATALSTLNDNSAKVTAGDRIQILPASFATAGRVNGVISINSASNQP